MPVVRIPIVAGTIATPAYWRSARSVGIPIVARTLPSTIIDEGIAPTQPIAVRGRLDAFGEPLERSVEALPLVRVAGIWIGTANGLRIGSGKTAQGQQDNEGADA